jgi:hypothetical protein
MLHRGAGTSGRRQVTKAHPAANSLAAPVELRQRVRPLPHDDRAASGRRSHLPSLVGTEKVDKGGYWRHITIVDQEAATHSEPRCEMPPVENRIRKPVSSVDENEVEGSVRKRCEHVMRAPYVKRNPCGRDLPALALLHNAPPLIFVGRDHLMIRPSSGKDDRARARSRLQRVETGLERPFEPVERLPLKPPELVAPGVKSRRRPAEISRYALDASSLTAPQPTHLTDTRERLVSPSCGSHQRR